MLEFKFPGHPAPPLGLLFKICTSIENWLHADPTNVACMHCLTGKGRTATILACYLTWVGETASVMEGLQYVATKRQEQMEKLTIPSQRRYLQYFSNMLDGVKPRSDPLLLRRVIMNTIPKFGAAEDSGDAQDLGCCPYIQLFKNGNLIFTAAWESGPSSSTTGRATGGSTAAVAVTNSANKQTTKSDAAPELDEGDKGGQAAADGVAQRDRGRVADHVGREAREAARRAEPRRRRARGLIGGARARGGARRARRRRRRRRLLVARGGVGQRLRVEAEELVHLLFFEEAPASSVLTQLTHNSSIAKFS